MSDQNRYSTGLLSATAEPKRLHGYGNIVECCTAAKFVDHTTPRECSLKSVAIVTITRSREDELLRCIESVSKQTYKGAMEHLIIGDESEILRRLEPRILDSFPHVRIMHVQTSECAHEYKEVYYPSRIGYLRNLGLAASDAEVFCHLDDDNTYDSDHVSSLATIMLSEPEIGIAYSWRRMQFSDGSPYLFDSYPWTPQARLAVGKPELSKYIFDELVLGGVFTPGEPVVRDTLVDRRGFRVYTVDTNELMVRREVHDEFKFVVDFEWREMVGDYSDDYAFVRLCHEAGIRFKSTERATVNYTIGGVSNLLDGLSPIS
jgi:glycosyltransferase involved in cell wall biosynthesis